MYGERRNRIGVSIGVQAFGRYPAVISTFIHQKYNINIVTHGISSAKFDAISVPQLSFYANSAQKL